MRVKGLWRLEEGWKVCKKKLSKFVDKFYNHAAVLAYHRVIDLPSDPQLIAVSVENFEQQLQVLKNNYQILSLKELGESIEKGKISNRSVVCTFDDGYSDNFMYAQPLLEKYQIPATFFVPTAFINQSDGLWWDKLENIFLWTETLPTTLILEIQGAMYSWFFLEKNQVKNNRASWYVFQPYPCCHFKAYKELHRLLRPLSFKIIEDIMQEIRAWAGIENYNLAEYRMLSSNEIKTLAQSSLIEVGSHTITHPVLSAFSITDQFKELEYSKKVLEELLSKKVTSIAYPFGGHADISVQTPQMVEDIGYCMGIANVPGLVSKKSDRYKIPRFLVRNWNGQKFANKLESWFSGKF